MAYIPPTSRIFILKDVPLDITYEHTLYFSTKTTQTEYFMGKIKTESGVTGKYALTNQSYQRLKRGWIRVNINAEDLYDCNYIMYQNTGFGSNRWFYAFIKSVEYINNNVSEIEFELDVMQTWFFDVTLQQSFVEREHADTDAPGLNLLPEPVPLGEYLTDEMYFPDMFGISNCNIVAACTLEQGTETDPFPRLAGGRYRLLYSGCDYKTFPNTTQGAEDLADYIESLYTILDDRTDSIVDIFYCPSFLITNKNATVITETTITRNKVIAGPIDGHTVRNKKLYTYPYNFLYVTNMQGIGIPYPYEYFNSGQCIFSVDGDYTVNPTVIMWPKNYKGSTDNVDESISVSGWPHCTFNTDLFKAWAAQAKFALGAATAMAGVGALMLGGAAIPATSALSVVSNSIGQAQTPTFGPLQSQNGGRENLNYLVGQQNNVNPIIGGAIGSMVGRTLADGIQRAINPVQQKGNQSGSALLVSNMLGFGFTNKHINYQYAEIIDDYFDKFGYSTKLVKVPNRNVREEWCYTKTIGCVITGSIPCEDERKICQIYDNGITFWKNPSHVGNYSLRNLPINDI